MNVKARMRKVVCTWLLALGPLAMAGELALNKPGAEDTVPTTLSKQSRPSPSTLESDPAQSAWRLPADTASTPIAQSLQSATIVASLPGARFTGNARTVPVKMRDPVIYLEFDVEVATASRYQIGGVLYGTDQSGVRVAVAAAQSAQLLLPGVHGMTLFYGQDILDGLAVGAPWEIRDLQLVDQADMALQEKRVQALVLERH